MLNEILDGISEKLKSAFGGAYKIYAVSVKQGSETPYFFIQLITADSKRMLGERFLMENLFCIQHFPEPSAAGCQKMRHDLFFVLEYITVDGNLLRGTKMRSEFVDGILNFYVNYNMFVKRVEEKLLMEILETPDIKTKG